MAKAFIHARSSAAKFGGTPEEYEDIHIFLDGSKGAHPDNRHRAATHTAWFISYVIPRVFGHTRVNSAGRTYSTVDVAEQHILEDYSHKFIPTLSDFLGEMEMKDWMQNGRGDELPPSCRKLYKGKSGSVTYKLMD